MAGLEGKSVIYIDECMFTTSSRLEYAFSAKISNIIVKDQQMKKNVLAVIRGVSAEGGLEEYLIKPKSIRSESFITFIENLLLAHDPSKIALFMDNC